MSNYQALMQIRSLSNIICNGNMCVPNHVRLFATPWTVAHKAPLPMGFPRQEYWSALPFPSPGDLPDPGTKPSLIACVSCIGRQILYQLSCEGSPWTVTEEQKNGWKRNNDKIK